jgi:hypothetical protein
MNAAMMSDIEFGRSDLGELAEIREECFTAEGNNAAIVVCVKVEVEE